MVQFKIHTLKKMLACLMLGVYVFGLIKPILPLVTDVLAHAFFESKHIATIHYENGKQHIHLELVKELLEGKTKQTPVLMSHESFLVHLKTTHLTFKSYTTIITNINTPYINNLIEIVVSPPLLPPKC